MQRPGDAQVDPLATRHLPDAAAEPPATTSRRSLWPCTRRAARLTQLADRVLVLFVSLALPAPGLAQTFALVIAGLCRATASHIAVDRLAAPLLVRIFTRLHRLAARFTSLVTQIQAGKLQQLRPARPAAGPRGPRRRRPRLPDRSGWLIRAAPGTAVYAGQVQALLDDPETIALLETAPQAGRILRPLCRMLAIPLPDSLARPPPRSTPPAGANGTDPPAAFPPPPPRQSACGTPNRAVLATGLPPRPD